VHYFGNSKCYSQLDGYRVNPNIKIQNPKQYQNPNAQNSKQKRVELRFYVLVIDISVI
jgi:hypothetical protein